MSDERLRSRKVRLVDVALWASSAGLTLVTVLLSIAFSPPGTRSIPIADELGHGLLYALSLFGFLLAGVWRPGRGDGVLPRGGLVLTIGAVVAGVAIEVLQEVATADRHAQFGDALAEGLGALAAFALHAWMRRRTWAANR